ncbi:MAG: cobalamin-dependent protein [Microthrixaceae bacterium]
MSTSEQSPGLLRAATSDGLPIRVVLAKLGLDGHDRGLKVVARTLRDAGCEVIYLGLRQTAETVVGAAIDEDADAIGISMHNGGHLTLAPRMVDAVRAAQLDTPVIVGGIIPEADRVTLAEAGVAAILTPGSSDDDVVNAIVGAVPDAQLLRGHPA